MASELILSQRERPSWKRTPRSGGLPADASPFGYASSFRDRVVTRLFDTPLGIVAGLGLIAAVALVVHSQFGGADARFPAVVLLSLAVILVVRYVAARSRDPPPLETGRVVHRLAPGELKRLATTLDRASSGLPYSQVVFLDRMAQAFLEKVRITRGLTPEDIEEAVARPKALAALLGDKELAAFVRRNRANGHPEQAVALRPEPQSSFVADVERTLAKMEAWR